MSKHTRFKLTIFVIILAIGLDVGAILTSFNL